MIVRYVTFGRATKETGDLLQGLMPLMAELAHGPARLPAELTEAARQAEKLGLLTLQNGFASAGPRLGVVSPALREQMLQVLAPALTAEMRWLKAEAVPRLEQAWAGSGRTQPWPEVAHTILAALCLDLGLRGAVLQAKILEHLPEGFYSIAFVGGTGGENAYGVKIWRNRGEEIGVGHLWHRDISRPSTFFPEDVQAVQAIVTNGEKATVSPASLLRLRFFGLIAPDGLRPAIPVVRYESGDGLIDAVEEVSRQCVQRYLAPALIEMEQLWPGAPPEQRMLLRQAVLRLVLEHNADRAVQTGVMPPFPSPAPKGWGSWIWVAPADSRFMSQVRESGG